MDGRRGERDLAGGGRMTAPQQPQATTRRRRRSEMTADEAAVNLSLEDGYDVLLETGTLLLLEAVS